MEGYIQLDFFALIDNEVDKKENDPCDNCNRPWCYGCPHAN